MRIAFYAPLKPPNHPVPSGDRRIGALLWRALERAGHMVGFGSEMQTYEGQGERWMQQAIEGDAAHEIATLKALYRQYPKGLPDLWFTYHNYYKAPDLIGPELSRHLAIPYVIAEASHAPKRANGPWAAWHARAAAASCQAVKLLCLTKLDRAMLSRLVDPARLVDLPAFIDAAPYLAAKPLAARPRLADRYGLDPDSPWLIAVAMMRSRDKLQSYQRLAEALALLEGQDWRLLIVGDGPARPEVEAAFRRFGARVAWLGARSEEELPELYAAADIYVWPAVNEAFGMAFLEAQAAGLPVVAGRVRGVPDVVREGETALLTEETASDFAAQLQRLLADPNRRRAMGEAARRFVAGDRDLDRAAARLDQILAPLGPT